MIPRNRDNVSPGDRFFHVARKLPCGGDATRSLESLEVISERFNDSSSTVQFSFKLPSAALRLASALSFIWPGQGLRGFCVAVDAKKRGSPLGESSSRRSVVPDEGVISIAESLLKVIAPCHAPVSAWTNSVLE